MKRAVNTGMGCALLFYLAVSITGYMALGDAVPGDILTGFTEPAGVVGSANVMVLLHMLPAYQVRVLEGSWGWEHWGLGAAMYQSRCVFAQGVSLRSDGGAWHVACQQGFVHVVDTDVLQDAH